MITNIDCENCKIKIINNRIRREKYCYNCYNKLLRTGQIEKIRFANRIDLSTLPTKLTNLQKSILTGSLLGDGWLSLNTSGSAKYIVRRKLEDLLYLKWNYNEFNIFQSRQIDIGKTFLSQTQKFYDWCRFDTRAIPLFGQEHLKWYKKNDKENRIKTIPKDINLDTLSLAIWFADDGYFYRKHNKITSNSYCINFSTNGFNKEDVEFLKELANNTFNIKLYLQKKYDKWILVQIKNSIDIMEIIKNHLIEFNMIRKLKHYPNIINLPTM